MNIESDNKSSNLKYQLVSIEKTNPPEGMKDGDCYRYVICRGRSEIVCIRSGTLQAVTEYAEDFAKSLNNRASTGYSTYAARKQKK